MAGLVGTNSSQTGTVSVPAGAAVGDYAYIYVTSAPDNGGGSASVSPGNGWTVWQENFPLGQWQPHSTIFRKILTAADLGSTVNLSGTSNGVGGTVIVVYNDVVAENFVGWDDGWNGVSPPVSPSGTLGADQIAVLSGHDQGNYSPWTAPTSATMIEQSTTAAGTFNAAYVAESSTVAGGTWSPNDPTNNSNWGTSTLILTCATTSGGGDQYLGQFCIGEQITSFQLQPVGAVFNFVSGGTANLNLSTTGLVTGTVTSGNTVGPASFVFTADGVQSTATYDLIDCSSNGGDQFLGDLCIGEAVNIQLQPTGGAFGYVSGGTANLNLSSSGLVTGTVAVTNSPGPASFVFSQGGQNYTASYNLVNCTNSGGNQYLGSFCIGETINPVQLQPTGSTFGFVSGGTANLNLSTTGLLTGSITSGNSPGPASFVFSEGGQNYTASYDLIDCSVGSGGCDVCLIGDSIGSMTQSFSPFPSNWTVDALGGRPLATGTAPTGLTILQNKFPTSTDDVLVIQLGTNDSFFGANAGNYPAQITQAINTALGNGWTNIVWVNVYRDDQFGSPTETDAFNNALNNVAAGFSQVEVCDWAGFIRNNTNLLQDGTHPTVTAGTDAFRDRVTACANSACSTPVLCESMSQSFCLGVDATVPLQPAGSNFQVNSGALPTGMFFDANTDTIFGTPTVLGSGAFSFSIVGTATGCTFSWQVVQCGTQRRSSHLII